MDEEKILNLWGWFYANEQRIRDSIEKNLQKEQEIIVQNLDNLILDMGMFSWDIGPSDNKGWFFTISPNGDKQLLEKTKEIVANAPELATWEFNYAKPAKNWDRLLSIYDAEMNIQSIDVSSWNFVTIKVKEGKIKLILEANNINHLDSETASTAANLFIINEIGEETKILNIDSIEVTNQLGSEHGSAKINIGGLKEYF